MSKISDHCIGTSNGSMSLLSWLEQAKYRHYEVFPVEKQMEAAKKVARIEDKDGRALALELLENAERVERKLAEARREFETLHKALTKISEDLDSQNDCEHTTPRTEA